MSLILKLSESDSQFASQFESIIQDFKLSTVWSRRAITDQFKEWAMISYDEAANPQSQE
jgi:hypothetical protein